MKEEMMSLPPREAWIEMWNRTEYRALKMSLPPREAWIEIRATMVL